jgi:dihydrolipoamide dehydrogenase
MSLIQVPVPDLGDIADAAVIEILVKVGDTIAPEQSLITLESDKASMEVPAPQGGVVRELLVKLGDKVGQGKPILMLEVAAATAAAPAPTLALATPSEAAAPTDTDCDVLVLGAGPGGYSAVFRAADLGLKVILVERYAELGGVCLNVGCIPSKALLHVAAVMEEVKHFDALGVAYGTPELSLDKLRAHKSGVTGKLTGGLAFMAKARKVEVVRGYGVFTGPNEVKVELTQGGAQDKTGDHRTLRFKRAIVAAGSQAVHLPFLPDDPRVVDSTGALALPSLPKRMLIIGGGIIGLEMATVYASLGARIDVVEMGDQLMLGADRDLVKVWEKFNAHRFDRIMLSTKTVAAKAQADGIHVEFEAAKAGEPAPAAQTYDLVLQAVGRTPNGRKIGADKISLNVNERGFVPVDAQMRTNLPQVFAIGDIVGQPMLAHKAVHEGHVAAEVIAGELLGDAALASRAFDARVIPSVAYTDPEVAWVGLTEDQAKAQGKALTKGLFPWSASGRALANGRSEGFTKLLFDADTHQIVGGGIVGTHAGDLIGEIALAIEMGADAVDIGKTIHPHPTLGESLGLAAEAAHGSCTDLPPVRKR